MDWIKIGIEIGILAFFALLYYIFQKRRIGQYQYNEAVEAFALWIYDYHQYLESIQGTDGHQLLNDFVPEVEAIDLGDISSRKQLAEKIPTTMPEELKSRLLEILLND